jgi:hypothetical protein
VRRNVSTTTEALPCLSRSRHPCGHKLLRSILLLSKLFYSPLSLRHPYTIYHESPKGTSQLVVDACYSGVDTVYSFLQQQPSAVVSVGPQLTAKAIGKSRHDTATCPTCLAEKKTKATTPARTAKRRKIKAKRKNQENEGVTPASTGSADGPSVTAPRKLKRIVRVSLLFTATT